MTGANQAGNLDWLEQEFARLDAIYRDLDGDISRRQLRHLWQARLRPFWRTRRLLYLKFARRLLAAGENYLAIEVCEEGLSFFPQNRSLLFHLAQACARTGSTEQALAVMEPDTRRRDQISPELAGQLARLYSDLWMANAASPQRREFLQQAHDFYQLAMRPKTLPAAQPGDEHDLAGEKKLREERRLVALSADAALVALFAGDETMAREVAARRIAEAHTRFSPDPYRDITGIAECHLVRGDLASARTHYEQARTIGARNRGEIVDAREQARLLLRHLGRDEQAFDEYFVLPDVLVFAGHMIDPPGFPSPRFPASSEETIRQTIRSKIPQHCDLMGYSSAACGGDILFLEEMQRAGHETHIVLPVLRREFHRMSVAREGTNWSERFDAVLAAATSVTEIAAQPAVDEGNTFYYGNLVLCGMAHQEAGRLGSRLRGLAVWDGQPGRGRGGTADCVRFWRYTGAHVEVIPPLTPESAYTLDPMPYVPKPFGPWEDREEILTVLAARFFIAEPSSKDGLQLRARFLDALGAFLSRQDLSVCQMQFFHQSFYLVFRDPSVAGRVALDLQQIARTAAGTAIPLSIGLHAGPVLLRRQLLGDGFEFLGPHVDKAETLAALDSRSQVQVSREFDAITALDPSPTTAFHCVYQGTRNLPGFAWQPIYRLQT